MLCLEKREMRAVRLLVVKPKQWAVLSLNSRSDCSYFTQNKNGSALGALLGVHSLNILTQSPLHHHICGWSIPALYGLFLLYNLCCDLALCK